VRPRFKPGWSPDLLLATDYLSPWLALRRDLFLELGGASGLSNPARRLDFLLRFSDGARRVAHLPLVLIHRPEKRPQIPSSWEDGRKAVSEAFRRRGVPAEVVAPTWQAPAGVGPVYAHRFPDQGPEVTILIPTKNGLKLVKA
jgi:hypothetical protein